MCTIYLPGRICSSQNSLAIYFIYQTRPNSSCEMGPWLPISQHELSATRITGEQISVSHKRQSKFVDLATSPSESAYKTVKVTPFNGKDLVQHQGRQLGLIIDPDYWSQKSWLITVSTEPVTGSKFINPRFGVFLDKFLGHFAKRFHNTSTIKREWICGTEKRVNTLWPTGSFSVRILELLNLCHDPKLRQFELTKYLARHRE